jgi:hypothetical protein
MLRPLTVLPLVALVACVPDSEFAAVAITARPTARTGVTMAIEVFRDGYSELQENPVPSGSRTFEASLPRDATWLIATLLDEDGAAVASGEGPPRSQIVLDPAEFTINVTSERPVLGDQATGGRQLARLDDGSFAAAWLDGRRARARAFDATGVPIATTGVDGEVRAAPAALDDTDPAIEGVSIVGLGDRYLVPYQAAYRDQLYGEISPLGPGLDVAGPLPTGGIRNEIGASQLSVAPLGDGRLAVAWIEDAGAYVGAIHVSIVSAAGALASDTVLPGIGARPQLVARPGGLALLCIDDAGVRLDLLDAAGAPVGEPRTLVRDITIDIDPARIVRHGDGFAVAWVTGTLTGRALRAAVFAADGTPGKQVDVAEALDIDGFGVASAPGGLALAWSATRESGVFDSGRVLWTQLDDDLAVRFPPRRLTFSNLPQRWPSIVGLDDGLAIAWTETAGSAEPTIASRIRGRIVYSPLAPLP